MQTTDVFSQLLAQLIDPDVRIIRMKGGTRSGKTWAIIQLLNIIAQRSKKKRLISVVSETMPHLKRGAIRDFKNMLEQEDVYDADCWHDTDKTYSYEKATIEFFSADSPGKVHGPARDILYINEAINVDWEVYRQLAVRTTDKIIIDDNPYCEYWADSKLSTRKGYRCIVSTYKDNDMLSAAQIEEIESNREIDPEWWKVYGEGQTGSSEGLCIKKWDIVPDLPPRNTWKRAYIGIDFGWSAPTAIMLVVMVGAEVYIDTIKYKKNMDNPDIAQAIKDAGYQDIEAICDAAEPKSIAELRNAGIKAKPSDSKNIKLGIKIMNRYVKHYTARSLESIEENRQYRFEKDKKTDQYTDEPIDKHNHAKDAERYVFLNRLGNTRAGFDVT